MTKGKFEVLIDRAREIYMHVPDTGRYIKITKRQAVNALLGLKDQDVITAGLHVNGCLYWGGEWHDISHDGKKVTPID